MLSKSQARVFFLGGTGLFTAIFLALSIDSMRQIPKLTRQDELTDSVARGKVIWEANNCMGCHTLFGEGAYYAPELTKVVDRRGEAWIRLFLKDPEKMFPGQRKMVRYNFTEEQTTDVIAFLTWCGRVNLQGFPPKPPLGGLLRPTATTVTANDPSQPALFRSICVACHSVGGAGGVVGPALDEVYKRKTREEMVTWISDPQALKPGTPMPKIEMTREQLKEIVDYLVGLKDKAGLSLPVAPAQPRVDPKDFE
ncbi:MAG: cytochrome c [Verrucomicrobiales bacterium]|nr:cytochrome c [Verrucomicrobiales bacterium]